MPTNYPGGLDTTTQLPNGTVDNTLTEVVHAEYHNNIADAIIAIEGELGTDPSGSYPTVAAAVADAVKTTPSTSQIVQGSSDVIPLVVKLHSNTDLSNLFEARDATNNALAFIDRTGLLNAHAISIQGSPLASTNLSDSAQLARLASPTFTGTPAAPTATAGTNTTQIATTAFVTAAVAAATPGPGSIGTSQLADGSVTSAKIADGTIANVDVSATAAIAYSKLALTGNIGTTDLANGAVTAAKIANGTITAAQIANGAVGSSQIASAGVAQSNLAVKYDRGKVVSIFGSGTPITFTTPFTAPPVVVCGIMVGDPTANGGSGEPANYFSYSDQASITSTGFTLFHNQGGTRTVPWVAIGV